MPSATRQPPFRATPPLPRLQSDKASTEYLDGRIEEFFLQFRASLAATAAATEAEGTELKQKFADHKKALIAKKLEKPKR